MARYWIHMGIWSDDPQEATSNREKVKLVRDELETIHPNHLVELRDSLGLMYITTDFNDAKATCIQARGIVGKHYDNDPSMVYQVQVICQSECPKCGYLGRLADAFCFRCKTNLLPKECIEV